MSVGLECVSSFECVKQSPFRNQKNAGVQYRMSVAVTRVLKVKECTSLSGQQKDKVGRTFFVSEFLYVSMLRYDTLKLLKARAVVSTSS